MLTLESDVNVPNPVASGHPVGLDLGLDKFAATSDGELVEHPRFLSSLHRKLKLLQRKLKHKKKGSSNRHKLNLRIARLHQRISDTRKDWHFKLAHKLCDKAGMMFVEDIDFRTWAKGMHGLHTLDAGFGQFIEILKWVCSKRGVYFEKVSAYYTSQVCPQCDTHTGKKELNDRVHSCPECGYTTHRDVAAAQVIRNRGVSRLGRSLEENACGDDLTGTGNGLVKSQRSSEVAVERRDFRSQYCGRVSRRRYLAFPPRNIIRESPRIYAGEYVKENTLYIEDDLEKAQALCVLAAALTNAGVEAEANRIFMEAKAAAYAVESYGRTD
jgi:putative transposase